jgi:phage shock protein E
MRATMTKLWLLAVLLVAFPAMAAACGSGGTGELTTEPAPTVQGQRMETAGGYYMNVTPQELRSMLSGDDMLLVNVYAGDMGEIEGTDLFIPHDQITQRAGELPSQRDSEIVVYCRSGGSSAIAAANLVGMGYTNVWNLDGGMLAWEGAGYPLLR